MCLRDKGKILLAVASFGIASLLLPSGGTAHSRFKLPIDLTDESMCNVNKNTQMVKLLESTDLIMWDEAPMNNNRCFEALDRSLRDILGNKNSPFGGKSMILDGDFKQTLPIHEKGKKLTIVRSCITSSYLWQEFKVFVLTENIRLMQPGLTPSKKERNTAFTAWLLDIGNGEVGKRDLEDPVNSSWVQIPDTYCVPDDDNGLANLISFIYPPETLQNPSAAELQQKVIVCPKTMQRTP
ncbi:uncharacterized protein [Rutidosis leptorrhynchoides]|uniref:uncharacterized protein n=1 Tax=Rutidosis leptorrhynchoides TaxID=125765 RepID=UPI003A9A4EA6